MSLITDRKIFYVDSHQRESGTDSNFTYILNMDNKFYDSVCMLQCNIPKSYYLVQSGQNTFTLVEGTSTVTISLPIGNYGRSSFKTQLQTSLNASSPHSWAYNVAISSSTGPDTGLYYFSVTGNSSQPQFIFTNYLYEQFGFNANTTNTFIANSLTSVNVIKMQKEDSIYVHSNICLNQSDNIIQEIFGVQSPDYSNILFMTPTVEGYSKDMATSANNLYQFWVTDENGLEINFNGQNCVFTLLCYKKQNVWGLLKNYLKLLIMGDG